MQKLTFDDPQTKSADLINENVTALKALFPDAFTEGKVDFDVLKQLLGGTVDEREEKYGLSWRGKRQARQLALTPSTGTLRPCPEESVDWDSTKNLMIEGDNLEVLKLLQKSYAGKVKLIYIDPPYNTGKDFIYPDNFRDNIQNYLEITEQVEGGRKLTSNTDASGRFHTDWLNMIYPRLKLAKSLLKPDGVIFVSCDDNEVARLRSLIDEIFGEESFVAQIVWEKMYTTKNDASLISTSHDYIIVALNRGGERAALGLLPRTEEMDARYSNPDNDPRGPWKPIPLYADGERKNGRYVIVGKTGLEFRPPPNSHWRFVESDLLKLIDDNRVWFGKSGDSQPNLKRFLKELNDGVKAKSLWTHKEVGSNDTASREIKSLLNVAESPFSFPKPTSLISRIIEIGASEKDALILDFFAGSGTTGHAVMSRNAADGGNRRFILVQLPEPLDAANKEQKGAIDYCDKIGKKRNIAELSKDRLCRAATKIKRETPMFTGDMGFRVFKLATSNIRAWEPDRADLAQSLEVAIDHLKTDRTEQDILFELLLKLGLELTVPTETRVVTGHAVHSVGFGALMVCMSTIIPAEIVEPLALGIVAWQAELAPAGGTQIVFRDSAFADDVAKTNLLAILQQHGLDNVRSI
ncbi:site-specific DNA-methyltransferase [Azospirillum sp. 412522]|nr:site-specific DNA-methyltransferase [Azospirillum sp. 412522]MBY6260841.1 site-specific DNA-methyltransferase [Azospirillum sp. 412522]